MIAEETRLIVDEVGVTRRIPAGRTIPAQWEQAYEDGEKINEPDTKAQAGPEVDKAQKEADTTKANPVTQAATQAASRRRK
jgi:hypothetical protein